MGEIVLKSFTLGNIQTNCYYLYRDGADMAIVIDPADRGGFIFEELSGQGLKVEAILLTHGHFDHIYGVEELKRLSGCKVYAYEGEAELLKDPELNVSEMAGRSASVTPDVLMKDSEVLTLADMTFKVIHTPGHTSGSACFYFEEASLLISGDTLFQGSVGRTDFPTGSASDLERSIKDKLLALPDMTLVCPGHGDRTTIGFERENNFYL